MKKISDLTNSSEIILLTGATGLVGSHVLIQLIKNKIKTRVVYRQEKKLKIIRQLLEFYNLQQQDFISYEKGDLLDHTFCKEVMKNITHVIHCAGLVVFNSKQKNELNKNNVQMTKNLIDFSLTNSVKKFLFISSVSTLNKTKKGYYITQYAKSKKQAELEVIRGLQEGLEVAILNPATVLGPGDTNKGSLFIIQNIANNFKYYTEGANGFIDAQDLSKCILTLLFIKNSEINYTIVGENITFKLLFKYISEELKIKTNFKKISYRLSGVIVFLDYLKSVLFRKQRFFTQEMRRIAYEKRKFNNSIVVKEIGVKFKPIALSVKESVDFYKRYYSKKER